MKKRFICLLLSFSFVLYLLFFGVDPAFAEIQYSLCGKEHTSEVCLEFIENPNMNFREVKCRLDHILAEKEKALKKKDPQS